MHIHFLSPYPVKKLSEWTQSMPFSSSDHQICFTNNRFDYLDWISNQKHLPFVLIAEKCFLLDCELSFFKTLIDKGFLIGCFYQTLTEINTLTIPSCLAPCTSDEPMQIPYEIGLFRAIWNSLAHYKSAGLLEGFVHNISSPVTAISGKLSLAQMTGKNLSGDEKFSTILDQLIAMIRTVQWYNESLDYTDRQRIAVQENINKMLELMKSNLNFKHRIQIEYKSMNPSLVVKTSPLGFNFLFFTLLENIADQILPESKIFPLMITSETEENMAVIRFIYPPQQPFEFHDFSLRMTEPHHRLGISLAYLNWTYFIPEDIDLSTYQSEGFRVIQIRYKSND
jgi:hypothetical protein